MNKGLALSLSSLGALLITSCGGGSGGGSAARMVVSESSNGFGKLLPHRVFRADDQGMPTNQVVEITSFEDLFNVTLDNPILPPVSWPTTAQLPNGDLGNHFVYTQFSQPIDVDSVLDASQSAAVNSNLKGTITILALDPTTNTATPIRGRAFVGGKTYGSVDPGDPTRLRLETWVSLVGDKPVAVSIDGDFPGLGFPGTQSVAGFAGSGDLVSPRTFVFIPDADDDLTTFETFPTGVQIRMEMTNGVRGLNGRPLQQEALASSTVGPDNVPAEVAVSGTPPTPTIVPGNGDFDIDPQTAIAVKFTEPVQIRSVGELDDGTPPGVSAAIQLQFGPQNAKTSVPFHVRPFSVYDLSRLELRPAIAFPGSGPQTGDLNCGTFSQIDVLVNSPQFTDLAGNSNTLNLSTFFITGEGPGLVNAPVVPDVIYVARGGSQHGISVVDLNGFGQSTGNPTYDPTKPIKKGNSNFPNNPNVALQGSLLIPPLAPGTCTFDGGSAGVFTLTRDSSLNDRVVGAPILDSVGDMMIGHALDNTFNNGAPFGCQAGGGNICVTSGLKTIVFAQGGPTTLASINDVPPPPFKTIFGGENLVSWGPHPNPPPLRFPPLCLSPMIGGVEPTSFDVRLIGLNNLLAPSGLPQGNPGANIPPQGLLSLEQNTFFEGPSAPAQNIASCSAYMMRQQIGQFLYVIDRAASEVVVFNSNRFTVIERISLPDPTDLAMSPNLEFLAVTNQNADLVSIIDIDPTSSTFHQVIRNVPVGNGPIGIAWDPGNEDIMVCNQDENTVTIISAFTLTVRKVVSAQLASPFQVAITPRQFNFGFNRGVYFAYIANGDGSIALFESGPDGINGWGFDDVIGRLPFTFQNPKAIQADISNLNGAFWICHENRLSVGDGTPTGEQGGALSNVALTSGFVGQIPLDPGFFVDPQIREVEFSVRASIGQGQDGLTGVPVDFAFDTQRNQTGLTNYSSQFSAGVPANINGKSIVKPLPFGGFTPTATAQFMFVAVPNSTEGPGVLTVLDLSAGLRRFDTDVFTPGVQSINVSGVIGVSDFMRQ